MVDRIEKGDIELNHYPTEEMLYNFYTKPLQGALFRKSKDAILNIQKWSVRECVEEQ